MAAGDITIVPAQAAGFFSLLGPFVKNPSANTIDITEGMVNIGGNGRGYLIAAVTGFDPFNAANRDSSFSALTLGDDIYIYACQQASGYARVLCSKNATFPTGFTAINSRKIGGFHVGRTRPLANRFSTSYVPVTAIVPGSVWDLNNRPRVSPEGMTQFKPGLWGMIYLPSVISGAWPSVIFGSRYSAAPVRSAGGYSELDTHRGIHAAGMREPTFEEWLMMADGAPQGNDGNNDTAWTMTSNTGPCNTGFVAKSVSCANITDCVGSLWERLTGQFDTTTGGYEWSSAVVNTGQDAAIPRGQVLHVAWRSAVAGGRWTEGVRAGARTLYTGASPWNADGFVTARGVSESI